MQRLPGTFTTYSVQCGADQFRRNSGEANGCDSLRITKPGDCVVNSFPAHGCVKANRAQFTIGNCHPVNAIPVAAIGLCRLAFVMRCEDSYLVDPASSHMLVSKIKPCMSKYKQSIQ